MSAFVGFLARSLAATAGHREMEIKGEVARSSGR
jgi:hypothetical protein